jgi:hypothetical protein
MSILNDRVYHLYGFCRKRGAAPPFQGSRQATRRASRTQKPTTALFFEVMPDLPEQ